MEFKFYQLCGPFLERETQVPQSLGDTIQPIHYDKCNFMFAHSSSVPQPESPSSAKKVSSANQSSRKHQCVSYREPSTLTRKAFSISGNPPSVIWNDFQAREFEEAEEARELERLEVSELRDMQERTTRAATLVTSTRCDRIADHRNERSTPVSQTEATRRNKTSFNAARRENAVLRQRSRGGFRRDPDNNRSRMLYTKAAIALRKGTVDLERSIVNELDLPL
ncbi:hypothetical protein BDZ45DRAFT_690093 [Acephala macrosclerotiorum]|nr:hypothetical protein BDZ45DRAFT_690093 [Acephala macrosclerotiorum]